MTFWTEGVRQPVGPAILEDYTSGAALGASFGAGYAESLGQSADAITLDELQYGRHATRWGGRDEPSSAVVPPDEVNRRIAAAGVDLKLPFEDVRDNALQFLIDRAKEKRVREDMLNRAESGLLATPARFGVRFAANMLDPINVASAFIPVVGEERYAYLLAKSGGFLGRTATRFGVGAIEGAVGQAAIEPLRISQANALGDDYTINDSLANIAFGTVFGGGLHIGFGSIGEAMKWRTAKATSDLGKRIAGAPIEVKRDLLKTAFGQMASGREIDVQGLLDLYGGLSRRDGLLSGTTLGQRAARISDEALGGPSATAAPDLTVGAPALRGGDVAFPVIGKNGEANIYATLDVAKKAQQNLKRQGIETTITPKDDGTFHLTQPAKVEIVDQYPAREFAEKAIKRLPPADREGLSIVPMVSPERGAAYLIARGLTEFQAKAVEANPAILNDLLDQAVPANAPEQPNLAVTQDNIPQSIESVIRAARAPQYRLTDAPSSLKADTAIKALKPDDVAQATEELQVANENITRLGKQMDLEEQVKAATKELAGLDADASTYRKALQAAALCGLRS